MSQPTSQIASQTRWHRKYHRLIGSVLMIGFLIVAGTGLLLGWKKNSGGLLLADSRKGTSTDLRNWLPLDSLRTLAVQALREQVDSTLSPELDRIDARPDKGMVKFTFKHHFQAIQLDGASGKVLFLEKRRADWIEKLHDGSLLDHYMGLSAQPFKLLYTSLLGLGLGFLTISGFWLWLNPRRIRQRKNQR